MPTHSPESVRRLADVLVYHVLDGFYRAETLFGSVLWGGISVIMMIGATRRADVPTNSFLIFRLLAIVLLILDLLNGAAIGEWAGIEFWLFVLIAEYAAIIRTILPREVGKSAKKVAAAK